MNSPRFPARVALALGLYLAFTVLAIASFNLGPPAWLEALLSIAAAPGALLFLIWSAPLRSFGLAQGELISMPHPAAALLIAAFYCALAYGLARAIQRALRRRRQPL